MYKNVCKELDADKFETSKKIDKEAKKKAAILANKKIIAECVAYQDKIIRESNNDYATKNVIEALKEEAMRECNNEEESAKIYREHKFHTFRDQAQIWGPNDLGPEVRYINAWGLHPSCVSPNVLSQDDLDDLFGSQDVNTYAANTANQLVSEFFSPFEIVRANSVSLLSILKHLVSI